MNTIKITPYSGIKLLLLALVLFCAKANAQVVPFGMLHIDRDTETEIVEIVSATTGRIWMDRNLGATHVAINSTDEASYGDYYQWGRAADGHQLKNSTVSSGPVAAGDEGSDFINTSSASSYDWLSPQDDNRWNANESTGGAVTKTANDPCPPGYRLPTEAEWLDELGPGKITNAKSAFEILKLPMAGYREVAFNGVFYRYEGTQGSYWSCTVDTIKSIRFYFEEVDEKQVGVFDDYRNSGNSIRCIKD